ncbi:MAG: hypothetical protein F4X77_19865 [Acidobacteriia bacterium]|nr:hypothetical protein [Terriglobia bacterium]
MARDDAARVWAAGADAKELDTAIAADFLRRAKRVEALGYRSADAEFLTAVALLGGFFVRRQYRAFSGTAKGRAEVELVGRAMTNGHVRVNGRKPALYRLCGASLFGAVDCDDPGSGAGRARRAAKQRLLVLDYWIACIGKGQLLLTATHKAAYFASLGIGEDCFPAAARNRQNRRKLFPEGLPIGVPSPGSASVRFTYAHAGSSAHGMERHLASHEPLAAALAQRGIACEWVVLADSEAQFARLRDAWRRWQARAERDWSEGEYFELRRLVDKRRWQQLSREDVERYAYLSGLHRTASAEQRYHAWARDGAHPRNPGGDFAESCRYREVLMEFDYAAADAASR